MPAFIFLVALLLGLPTAGAVLALKLRKPLAATAGLLTTFLVVGAMAAFVEEFDECFFAESEERCEQRKRLSTVAFYLVVGAGTATLLLLVSENPRSASTSLADMGSQRSDPTPESAETVVPLRWRACRLLVSNGAAEDVFAISAELGIDSSHVLRRPGGPERLKPGEEQWLGGFTQWVRHSPPQVSFAGDGERAVRLRWQDSAGAWQSAWFSVPDS